MAMEKITVRIDPKLKSGLKELSNQTGASVQFLINKAIANYLRLRGAA